MPHLILENKNLILFLNLKFNFMNDILKCSPKRFLFSMVVASALLTGIPQKTYAEVDRSQSVMQTVTVKGTVLDANNEPIIGASVLMKGTTNGTITDIDGNFTLSNVNPGTLVVSYIGYKTREIYGQVANLTYISKETKDIVKRKAPADYREKLEEIIGRESITASLQENGLTEEIFTAGEKDVTKILADRRKQMALEIKEFYKTL